MKRKQEPEKVKLPTVTLSTTTTVNLRRTVVTSSNGWGGYTIPQCSFKPIDIECFLTEATKQFGDDCFIDTTDAGLVATRKVELWGAAGETKPPISEYTP